MAIYSRLGLGTGPALKVVARPGSLSIKVRAKATYSYPSASV